MSCWLINMDKSYLNNSIFRNLRFNLDRLGFCMSALCAVHCICLPILIVIMPFLAGSWIANRELEMVFAICSVLFALGCSMFSSRIHKKYWIPVIAFLEVLFYLAHITLLLKFAVLKIWVGLILWGQHWVEVYSLARTLLILVFRNVTSQIHLNVMFKVHPAVAVKRNKRLFQIFFSLVLN